MPLQIIRNDITKIKSRCNRLMLQTVHLLGGGGVDAAFIG